MFSSHWFFFTFSRSLLKFLLCLFILFSNSVRILITNALNSLVSKSFICFISLFFQGFSLALSIKKNSCFLSLFFEHVPFFNLFIITCIYHLSIAQSSFIAWKILWTPSFIPLPSLFSFFFFFCLSLTLWNKVKQLTVSLEGGPYTGASLYSLFVPNGFGERAGFEATSSSGYAGSYHLGRRWGWRWKG